MIHIGLDPSNNFGWAVLNEHGHRVESGTIVLKGSTWEGGGVRWLRLRWFLIQLLAKHGAVQPGRAGLPGASQQDLNNLLLFRTAQPGKPTVVVSYEKVFQTQKSGTAAAVYYGAVAVIKGVCEEFDVPYSSVGVGTLKKTATGKGNASKADVMDACVRRWRHDPDDDNESDALWCAETSRLELS